MKSRRLRWAEHVAGMGDRRGSKRALVGTPEGRRLLERPRHRWEGNIKMDLIKVDWGKGGGWTWAGSSWLRTGTGGRLL
jgi:hypothetical protein